MSISRGEHAPPDKKDITPFVEISVHPIRIRELTEEAMPGERKSVSTIGTHESEDVYRRSAGQLSLGRRNLAEFKIFGERHAGAAAS